MAALFGAAAEGDALVAELRGLALLAGLTPPQLTALAGSGLVAVRSVGRDVFVDEGVATDTVILIAKGQLSVGVFDPEALRQRGDEQRDAARGERDGTLMPPGPLARIAKQNLFLLGEGDLLSPSAFAAAAGAEVVRPFSLSSATVVLVRANAVEWIARQAPETASALSEALARSAARARGVVGVKREILDFYVRHGLSVTGPSVRLRQLDLCIDCKQCEEACVERHGAQRLTLGGFELGLLDFVYTCRTCSDARCLTPCEHDAIKRDAATGEIRIIQDRCIVSAASTPR